MSADLDRQNAIEQHERLLNRLGAYKSYAAFAIIAGIALVIGNARGITGPTNFMLGAIGMICAIAGTCWYIDIKRKHSTAFDEWREIRFRNSSDA